MGEPGEKRTRLINFKVNALEYDRIEEQARIHAGGNISVLLRMRGMGVDLDDREDDDQDDQQAAD